MMRMKNVFNRIEIAFVVGACLLLSACANSPLTAVPEGMAKSRWSGHPINEAVAKWGKPNVRVTPAGDGTTVYEWALGGKYTHTEYVATNTSNMFGDMMTSHPEEKVTTSNCNVLISADSNGIITNFETKRGCGQFFFGSDSISPDEATAAKGKILEANMRAVKRIDDRYKMVCAKPEYAVLFENPPCDAVSVKLSHTIDISKGTREQKELFIKWSKEMDSIVNDYAAFFRSTGDVGDKTAAYYIDVTIPQSEKDKAYSNEKVSLVKLSMVATATHTQLHNCRVNVQKYLYDQ